MRRESSSRVRERRLRAKYRRRIRIAIVICLIIGLAGGIALERLVLSKQNISSIMNPTATATPAVTAPAGLEMNIATPEAATPVAATATPVAVTATPIVVTPAPEATATPEAVVTNEPMSLSLTTPEPTDVPTAEPTQAPTDVPTVEPTQAPVATANPEAVFVPLGESYSFTSQIYSDGSGRVAADGQTYETLNFDMRVTRYLTPEYYSDNYSTRYKLRGTEAGVEFELTLKDYMGSAVVIPQNMLVVSLENADGTVERGFQLTDAEIQGENEVAIETNVPKNIYKRFTYNQELGDMTYLCVTIFNDGVAQNIKFELGAPLRPTPEPEPTVFYASLKKGDEGDDVQKLQARLIEKGFLDGEADGEFGRKTRSAVEDAQKAFGMEETGVADHEFQVRLFAE